MPEHRWWSSRFQASDNPEVQQLFPNIFQEVSVLKNWRANDYCYEKLKLKTRQAKPRTSGLTAILDYETDQLGWAGLSGVCDLLEVAGDYIDIAKIAIHHALMLPHDYIKEKLSIYRDYEISPMIGGILWELAYAQDALDELVVHINRLGASTIELSENYVTLTRDQRLREIERLKKHRLNVMYEFGRRHVNEPLDIEVLEAIVKDCLDSGVDHIVIEEDEIDLLEETRPDMLDELKGKAWFNTLFFEAGQWSFPNKHASMIKRLGPEINFCNINPGQVMRLEDFRIGMGRQVGFPYLQDLLRKR